MAKKKPTVSKLKKKLDAIFSKYIRLKYAFMMDGELSCTCVTCGRTLPVKNMQAGHFMSRRHNSTRFDEMNVHPQDMSCNMYNQGCQYEHGLYIDKTYGNGTADSILKKSKELKQFKTFELEEMIKDYTQKVKDLENN